MDALEERTGANQLERIGCKHLHRGRRRFAERLEPVTKRAVFGSSAIGGSRYACVMTTERGIFVEIVGRVPSAQRSGQDEDDRQQDDGFRAQRQRSNDSRSAG